ncbi:hypothetical protein Nepgr_024543 [Nepenthes gracilis]|uniref:Uncharacterized protein n=1 Tax=Nepenthes gracilis TaxID=150966 RepID=A0AAD3T3I0_NEPGR|nr:hypothetical protein Nepgr_024543 [Nepenthes gracilis]
MPSFRLKPLELLFGDTSPRMSVVGETLTVLLLRCVMELRNSEIEVLMLSTRLRSSETLQKTESWCENYGDWEAVNATFETINVMNNAKYLPAHWRQTR